MPRQCEIPAPEGVGNFDSNTGRSEPRGSVPEGKTAQLFKLTLITENANHKDYHVSLRSSSMQVPSNPSPNGVKLFV